MSVTNDAFLGSVGLAAHVLRRPRLGAEQRAPGTMTARIQGLVGVYDCCTNRKQLQSCPCQWLVGSNLCMVRLPSNAQCTCQKRY